MDCQPYIFHKYRVTLCNKAVISDDKEMSAFRSMKALKFAKEGYILDVRINKTTCDNTYVQCKVLACIDEAIGDSVDSVELCL